MVFLLEIRAVLSSYLLETGSGPASPSPILIQPLPFGVHVRQAQLSPHIATRSEVAHMTVSHPNLLMGLKFVYYHVLGDEGAAAEVDN
ncbi:hypothetical protein AVEN_274944-1 [Araneus ventricosus]|uniref:Uncharacterized protein n=1 Tax=Araneus ventricosus TaxID=182803 RepID=A0A4Y2AW68_ARAVE|nr:hypothetical protein AVEN_274944-1 [Araneus ventricosus]